MRKLIYFSLLIFFSAYSQENNKNQYIINGQITNLQGQPIKNVNLKYNSYGTISNINGNYQLKIKKQSNVKIEVSHVSYKYYEFYIDTSNSSDTINYNILLEKNDNFLKDINLTTDEYRYKGVTKIDPKNLGKIPSNTGGVENIIKLLPGVSSNNELSSQYSVRGGNYDENLIYVNGIQIYKPFLIRNGEQEGLSFINSNMISSIEFSAGGFEAKFGDKLSSVLNIEYKIPKHKSTTIGMSALGFELNSEGSSKNHLLSYLIGYRHRSNSFLFRSLDTQGEYKPLFNDFQTFITYQINPEIKLSFLNYYSQNKYEMIPKTRNAKFGTVTEALQLTIYFEGKEIDNYETNLTAISSTFQPNELLKIKLTSSFFTTKEQEFYDILGEYWLAELNNDIGSDEFGEIAFNRGVGAYMNHARNELRAKVFNLYHDGNLKIINEKNPITIDWGIKYQHENIKDRIREWEMVDSAGYAISPINNNLNLFEFFTGSASISSNRISSYAQISNKIIKKSNHFHYSLGSRLNYWTFNNEIFISPRAIISYKPNWEKDWVFLFSCGSYNQSPFFKEFRNYNGELNKNIKSQKSIHYVLNTDYQFKYLNRPFKFTGSIYFKKLWDIIPFEIDNLRIIYTPENNANGYATGIDMKLFGEFVPSVDSWISLSLLKTQEDIDNDGHGYIDRPTDRRLNASVFFQDYFPNNPNYKMQLSLVYGSGLPFGAPHSERHEQTSRIPPYRRLDIGFSRSIKSSQKDKKIKFLNHFESIWASIEFFNLIGIKNTSSYIWVSDASNTYYAVPNYLTSRMINFKLNIKF
tara:strand:- start:362 stop:2779 length:2418 start_codon:yes stop_codon:yes gene_type:complete